MLLLHIGDARRGTRAYRRRLEPDPQNVARTGGVVTEVLHAAAETDSDFGINAASRDLGFGDEAGPGQCFRVEQEQRERKGRGRSTC